MSLDVVDLSRLQFALTALYHFLFVPLTIGLSIILGLMESVYVFTKNPIWRRMTKYWGILFGINFAMGVATGITMEFQFGTNWAYYSRYVGDIFGAPLAIEGMMAFFLEATFVGLFFFGWKRLSRGAHLFVTWMVALGSNLSALWILIANGWMQHPVGSYFNYHTMRMEVSDFYAVILNPVAQAKFVHTVSAAYITGSMFVLSISAYFLLNRRFVEMAKRSMVIAATFGLASAFSVVVLGDESGYLADQNQQMKVAAIEGTWRTEKPPAAFTVVGLPDQDDHVTKDKLQIPYLLGLVATRSLDKPVLGINDLVKEEKAHIKNGIPAYLALQTLKRHPTNQRAKKQLENHSKDLGYALLLKKYAKDMRHVTKAEISKTAWSAVPEVAPLFWSFRVMVLCGVYFIVLFMIGFYMTLRQRFDRRWFLKMAFYSLPLPWIASEVGWFVAEFGRQPWVIEGVLPTYMGTSSVAASNVWVSLIGFILFYTGLAVVDVFLMVKYIRLGPDLSLPKGE